jgi:PAS domain S-box-containing protein
MSKIVKPDLSIITEKEKAKYEAESAIADKEKAKLADELVIAREEKTELADELATAKEEKTELADELIIANVEKAKREDELIIANEEKKKRAAELVIANKEKADRAAELVIANAEKAKRSAELVIANEEKEKRASELVIANAEKAKRAAELVIANAEKAKRAAVLIIANLEKEKRADELIIAGKELTYQNEEKLKRAAELVIADINKTKREAELVIAKIERAKRIAKSIIADKELSFQTGEKSKRAAELVIADAEKAKLASELVIANIKKAKRSAELVIANVEKAKRSAELVIANKELVYQKSEKSKREAELIIIIANVEKAKRAAQYVIANIEKSKRAAEFVFMNKGVVLAKEKERLVVELTILNKKLLLANEQENIAKEKYIELYDFAPTGYFTLNREGKIIELNLFTSHILNKELSFLKDHWFGNFVSDKTKPVFNHFIEQVFKSKTKESCDLMLLTDSGFPKYVYLIGLVTNNSEQCLITINDITDRKQAENALRESEKRFKAIFDQAPIAIALVDTEGHTIITNLHLSDMVGYSNGELSKMKFTDFTYHEDVDKDMNQFIDLTEGRISNYSMEKRFVHKNGNLVWVNLFVTIIHDENAISKKIIGMAVDITERKQTELALKESEEKSRSIMENSADAIFVTNQNGKYIYTNKEVTAMLGYTTEEMKSKTIADITNPDKQAEIFKIFTQVLNGGKGFTEIELLRKEGNYITTDLNAALLPDGTVYGSCRDITERKRTELELINAKDKAEESDRLKSAFLTNMSHEIRTPMNGILGFAELLKEPNLTIDEQQDYILTMQISGARMLNTINSIVDISKIESGLIGIDIKETNLNEKIEFIYKFFKPEVEIKKLQFLFKNGLPTNEAIIKTDNGKVYGILTNLVRNAIKFTYDGSIEFGYKKKGEYLEFYVKDTGIGIPKSQQEIIFERFRQGSESHDRGYEGSGLGLSISKSYVEMLGGRIWMESVEGFGSTFYFTIPYIAVSEEKPTIENISLVPNEVQLKNLKILIVEDDEISYSLLSITVQKISKEVLHVITGVQAVEACRNNPDLDLILMDIRMPQMNGLEATQQIRQFNTEVIIIAQTAYGFSGDREKAIEAGCNDYISKPINKTLLYELIEKHCNK